MLLMAVLTAGCTRPAETLIPSADIENVTQEQGEMVVIPADRVESVLSYENGLILSHISGYLSYYQGGKDEILVPHNAGLRMPTGMAIKEHWLFIADRDRVAVFDLEAPSEPLQEITFGPNDTSINDVFVNGDALYTSVTGSGCIYRTDVSDPSDLSDAVSEMWLAVPGPNGITIGGGKMYIASISPDYTSTRPENVVYVVEDLQAPSARAMDGVAPGRYDGVTLSDDGLTLYISDWDTASVMTVDLTTGEIGNVYQMDGLGPADIDVEGDTLYVPDMNGNRILVITASVSSIGMK